MTTPAAAAGPAAVSPAAVSPAAVSPAAVSPATATHRARQMLARAHWAAGAFADYDRASVLRIAEAVATTAHAQAARYADWAVKETGFGVVEHKIRKNEACSLGVFERYSGEDYVSPRVDADAKIVSLPRPAGVILALTPSTNPVCSVFFKVMLALLTRNAIVISPHPMARECCGDAARLLAAAATKSGAPDGTIGVVEDVTVPLIEALMADPVTSVIVATGGTAVVRAAHRSGNPALGVGPGNVPVLVDATADLADAAQLITESKAFDNSVLCTNESVLVVEDTVSDRLLREMQRRHAVLLDEAGRDKLRDYLFPAAGSTARRSARMPPGSLPGPGCGYRRVPGCCSRRSTWCCPRRSSPARSSARCSAWSGPARRRAASRPPAPWSGLAAPAIRRPCTATIRGRSCGSPSGSRCCGSRSMRATAPAVPVWTRTWLRR